MTQFYVHLHVHTFNNKSYFKIKMNQFYIETIFNFQRTGQICVILRFKGKIFYFIL